MHIVTSKTAQFNAIYYATHKKLHSTVLKLCKDSDLTLDILQKVYLQLWEKWDDIQEKEQVYPFLFTLSKNLFIDEIRKESRKKAIIDSIQYSAEVHSHTVESLYKRKEYQGILNSVLSRLTSRRREVIGLYLNEGLGRQKIAERLSVSPNTIDNHLQESLSILRVELKTYLDNGID